MATVIDLAGVRAQRTRAALAPTDPVQDALDELKAQSARLTALGGMKRLVPDRNDSRHPAVAEIFAIMADINARIDRITSELSET